MKYCRYNSILKVDDNHHILYCALSDQFIILRESAYHDISNYDADTLAKENSILYDQLISAQGIIRNHCEEQQLLYKKIRG